MLCIPHMKAIPLCFDGMLRPCCNRVVLAFPASNSPGLTRCSGTLLGICLEYCDPSIVNRKGLVSITWPPDANHCKIMPWADSILSDKSDQPSFGNWPANHPSSLSQIYPVTPHRDDHTTALFVVITTTVASIGHCPATAFRIPNHAPFFDQIGHFILTLYNGFATCYRRFRCRWRHWWSTVVKISGPPQTWRATGRNSWWRRIWSSLKKGWTDLVQIRPSLVSEWGGTLFVHGYIWFCHFEHSWTLG